MITRYPFPRRKLVGALFTLYLFLLMYLSRDSQAGLYLLGFYRAQFLSMGVTALAALALLFYNRKRIPELLTDGRIVLAILFSLTLLIPMALKRDWQMMYFSMVYCVLAAVLISFFATPEETARQYVVLMCLLSGFSLLCSYLLRIPADRGILVPPTFRNSFDAQFYNYIFSFVSVSFAKSRNFGIFREPGVHQFFLFLALYLNNYQVSWKSERTMWAVNALLTVTMLSTFATGGVAVTAVFLLAVYFDKGVYKTRAGRILTAAVLVCAGALAVYLIAAKPALYTQLRLMGEKIFSSNPSLDDRVESITFNLGVLHWTPFRGRDIDYILHTVTHNTSSSTILFAVQGLFFGWVNLLGWITLVFRGKGCLLTKLISVAALAATFNTENLITNPYLWLFPILVLTEELLPLLSRKKAR